MAEYIVKETDLPLATKQEVVCELIRCKDCKWSIPVTSDEFCICGHSGNNSNKRFWKSADGFCDAGERMQ